MKYFIVALSLCFLVGCDDGNRVKDQCKREELFKQCMDAVPTDKIDMSEWTSYDTSRLVQSCRDYATSGSYRDRQHVKRGCV